MASPAAHDALAKELLRLETALARRDFRGVPGGVSSLLDAEFVEYGSNGRVWDRAAIVEALSAEPDDATSIQEFAVRPLADDVVLATFRTTHPTSGGAPVHRIRSSIWLRRGGRWLLRFHQGTPTTL